MSGYPLLLDGTRIEGLVVGGGPVAHRKVSALIESGARVRVVALKICDALRVQAADCPRLVLIERAYVEQDIGSATIVIAATNVRAVNAQIASDASQRGRLVNVADAPGEGNCATVATHRTGSLIIGVSAGGVPAAAARIRDAIAARFDGRFTAAIAALGGLRDRLLASGRADDWRAAERDLLTADFCARVEDGTFAVRAAHWEGGAQTGSGPVVCR